MTVDTTICTSLTPFAVAGLATGAAEPSPVGEPGPQKPTGCSKDIIAFTPPARLQRRAEGKAFHAPDCLSSVWDCDNAASHQIFAALQDVNLEFAAGITDVHLRLLKPYAGSLTSLNLNACQRCPHSNVSEHACTSLQWHQSHCLAVWWGPLWFYTGKINLTCMQVYKRGHLRPCVNMLPAQTGVSWTHLT